MNEPGHQPGFDAANPEDPRLPRTLVLVGLMGAGKTAVGRRLAARLNLTFVDADHEIEAAAGCSVEEIFARYGEPEFRNAERRIVARLLSDPIHILATGGGAFMDPQTRARIAATGLSLWLRADLDLLVERTSRRHHRPLLKRGDPRRILAELIARRYPVYETADMVVDSNDAPPERTVDAVIAAIRQHLANRPAARSRPD